MTLLSPEGRSHGPDPTCAKCGGTGSYSYDRNHGKICEVCCPHNQGWWLLREHYGAANGKYACKRGCGEVRAPEQLNIVVPDLLP